MNKKLYSKLKKLRQKIKKYGRFLIAFSGGVDSSFLLKAAAETLGPEVLAVTADSVLLPKNEMTAARKIAGQLQVRHRVVKIDALADKNFVNNQKNRCYWCKKNLFKALLKIARTEKIKWILEGSNLDDLKDYRPGEKALAELKIVSPLREAGLTKKEIRCISAELNLPTADKPAMACLASRIPYGTKITALLLKKINQTEKFLKKFGLTQVRVRHHGDLARIEILPADLGKIMPPHKRAAIIRIFKKSGYHYVTLDLQGYRTGSLNEVIKQTASELK